MIWCCGPGHAQNNPKILKFADGKFSSGGFFFLLVSGHNIAGKKQT